MTRVVLPTDDGQTLAHFGIARSYAVFEVEDGRVLNREDRANPDPAHENPAHHKLVLDTVRDCQVVIASHMGPPMVRSLQHIGARVLLAPSEDVTTALGTFLRSGGGALSDFPLDAAAPPPGHVPHDDHEHDD